MSRLKRALGLLICFSLLLSSCSDDDPSPASPEKQAEERTPAMADLYQDRVSAGEDRGEALVDVLSAVVGEGSYGDSLPEGYEVGKLSSLTFQAAVLIDQGDPSAEKLEELLDQIAPAPSEVSTYQPAVTNVGYRDNCDQAYCEKRAEKNINGIKVVIFASPEHSEALVDRALDAVEVGLGFYKETMGDRLPSEVVLQLDSKTPKNWKGSLNDGEGLGNSTLFADASPIPVTRFGDRCSINFFHFLETLWQDSYQDIVVHELGHCWQFENLKFSNSNYEWWFEGGADFMTWLYNAESTFLHSSSPVDGPLIDQSYEAWQFWAWLFNKTSISEVKSFWKRVPTAAPANSLASLPGDPEESFFEFVEAVQIGSAPGQRHSPIEKEKIFVEGSDSFELKAAHPKVYKLANAEEADFYVEIPSGQNYRAKKIDSNGFVRDLAESELVCEGDVLKVLASSVRGAEVDFTARELDEFDTNSLMITSRGSGGSSAQYSFDVTEAKQSFSGKITFLSDEYPEWYGSEFNDAFSVTLSGAGGTRILASGNVNSSSWGAGDYGFSGATKPREVSVDLSNFIGETVTISVYVRNVGDEDYQSAVLVDGISNCP